ncbi:hypothetical protein GCM10027579_24720 [Calidifontibacter terrae]
MQVACASAGKATVDRATGGAAGVIPGAVATAELVGAGGATVTVAVAGGVPGVDTDDEAGWVTVTVVLALPELPPQPVSRAATPTEATSESPEVFPMPVTIDLGRGHR